MGARRRSVGGRGFLGVLSVVFGELYDLKIEVEAGVVTRFFRFIRVREGGVVFEFFWVIFY